MCVDMTACALFHGAVYQHVLCFHGLHHGSASRCIMPAGVDFYPACVMQHQFGIQRVMCQCSCIRISHMHEFMVVC
jgi:hypothetical protein